MNPECIVLSIRQEFGACSQTHNDYSALHTSNSRLSSMYFNGGILSVEGFTFHAQEFKYMKCGVLSIRRKFCPRKKIMLTVGACVAQR